MRSARLTPVEVDPTLIGTEEPEEERAVPPSGQATNALTALLIMSLRALSARAVVALSNLFMAASAGSAWWLWYVTMPQPSVPQLVGLTLYAGFVLALNYMLRRR